VAWNSAAEKQQNLQDLKNTHAQMGWRLLMNEHVLLQRGTDSIALVGIENWSDKARFPKYGDMAKACSGLTTANAPVKILMSHDPSHWNAEVIPKYGDVDLTLSGHTHGMQFGVDSKWLKWSPVQYMYKQWAGLYQEGNQYLYVNRGFGFLGYPGRLGILPEITVIELA
jgi:predicted MPP superfamily phosphohydrolase